MLCPWADVLYARDDKWWKVMAQEAATFTGEKYAWQSTRATPAPCEPAGNSGACAILLAHHFGVKRITLLGYDCKVGSDGKRHWHGKHRRGLGDAVSLPKFYKQFQEIAPKVSDILIRNASRDTDLDIWPASTLESELESR